MLGTFIDTLGFATELKRRKPGKSRTGGRQARLERLQAELDELKEVLGYHDHPAIKKRPGR